MRGRRVKKLLLRAFVRDCARARVRRHAYIGGKRRERCNARECVMSTFMRVVCFKCIVILKNGRTYRVPARKEWLWRFNCALIKLILVRSVNVRGLSVGFLNHLYRSAVFSSTSYIRLWVFHLIVQ